MSFSSHTTNKANNTYVLGKDFVQGHNTLCRKDYKTNFTEANKKFVLSLHYSFSNSYSFANGVQELKFKAKVDQIQRNKLCVGNLISNWITTNPEKTGLYGKVYDFVVDYQAIDGVKKTYDMHRYLMINYNT